MMAFVSHICLSLNWLQHCLHMKLQKCLGTPTFTREGIDPGRTVPLTDALAPALMSSSRVLYEPDNDDDDMLQNHVSGYTQGPLSLFWRSLAHRSERQYRRRGRSAPCRVPFVFTQLVVPPRRTPEQRGTLPSQLCCLKATGPRGGQSTHNGGPAPKRKKKKKSGNPQIKRSRGPTVCF